MTRLTKGSDIGEDTDDGRAGGHDGQRAPEVLAVVVADDGDAITSLQAQLEQSLAERAHLRILLLPGIRLPDSQVFLAHSDFGAAAVAAHILQPELTQRFRRHGVVLPLF